MVTSYDPKTKLKRYDELALGFPHTGQLISSTTVYFSGNDFTNGYVLSKTVNTLAKDLVSGGTLFPMVTSSLEQKWDIFENDNGNWVMRQPDFASEPTGALQIPSSSVSPYSSVITKTWFDDQDLNAEPVSGALADIGITYGNIRKITVDYGADGTVSTVNQYDNLTSSGKWHLGRLRNTVVTHTRAGYPDVVRESHFEYYPSSGLLWKETVDADRNPAADALNLDLTTQYERDIYGNVTEKKVYGTLNFNADDQPIKGWRTVAQSTYDDIGRYAKHTQDAAGVLFGYQSSQTITNAFGSSDFATGPNGLKTRFEYDAIGRAIFVDSPDDNDVTTTHALLTSSEINNHKFTRSGFTMVPVYRESVYAPQQPESHVYYDVLGRPILRQSQKANGTAIYQATVHNDLGQVIATSGWSIHHPKTQHSTINWSTTQYDVLGRLERTTTPFNSTTRYQFLKTGRI